MKQALKGPLKSLNIRLIEYIERVRKKAYIGPFLPAKLSQNRVTEASDDRQELLYTLRRSDTSTLLIRPYRRPLMVVWFRVLDTSRRAGVGSAKVAYRTVRKVIS